MRYDGGKGKCFQRIINLMPPHRVYIEAFLGGGAVLRHKKPAERTIAIDIDPSVIAKWRRTTSSDVELRCEDALNFLRENRFLGDELVYADPPYLTSTRRRSRCYRYDFETSHHVDLLSLLGRLNCAIIISGYPSQLYDEVLAGWQRVDFPGTSHVGRRIEAVWLNFEAALSLHDYRFLGDTFRERERLRRKLARWEDRLARMPVLERQALLNALNERFPRVPQAGCGPISRPSVEREAPISIAMPGVDG